MQNASKNVCEPLHVVKLTPKQNRNFWSKVLKPAESGCWIWIGCTVPDGYGVFHLNGRNLGAHRVSYMMHKGAIPAGIYTLHKCDNPPCINPDHLFLGTQQMNVDDKESKGRANHASGKLSGRFTMPHRTARGENQGHSVLTELKVSEIRKQLVAKKPQAEIARDFGVSTGCISHIVHGRSWNHIK